MEKTSSERIVWVDIAKYICIFFVMCAHIETYTNVLSSFCESFFLMGFLFVAGYCYKNKYSFLEFLKRKTFQLLIPFFIWGALSILFHQLFPSARADSGSVAGVFEEIGWFLLQIRGVNDGPWFIALMFIAYLPFYFLIKLYEKKRSRVTTIVFAIVLFVLYLGGEIYSSLMSPLPYGVNALPLHIEYLPKAFFFMFLGYEFKNSIESRLTKINKYVALAVITPLYIGLVLVSLFNLTGFNPFANIGFVFVYRIIGVIFLIYLSKALLPLRYFLFIGQNTIVVFPLHIYFVVAIRLFMHRFLNDFLNAVIANTFYATVFTLFEALVISLAAILPILVINKWLPIMSGKYIPATKVLQKETANDSK